ncbi:uncharacterized protein LOC119973753 isoform X2 [Scyliorhinus canicula]|uniref:uncharacterized protein LOC119973753 isoform X2 n=1 Tax=Scyliorhinus canicula TaxID=7830 RepID=UPI0018F792D2|nr:uncharacterized protein LOC119973753 isoform X2 [Scyliorhinus canicula]
MPVAGHGFQNDRGESKISFNPLSFEFTPEWIINGEGPERTSSLTSVPPRISQVLNFNPVLMLDIAFPRNRIDVLGGKRELEFPKHHYAILKQIIYCSKFNTYFALGKDCSLKVYNKDFCETFTVLNLDLKLVKSIIFNPEMDELITGGVGGVKFWKYKMNQKSNSKVVAMSNYELYLRADYPHMGGNWVTKVELDVATQQVFCCSVQALFCYDTEGKLLLEIPNPHKSSPTACIYSSYTKEILTCSTDCEIKAWSNMGIYTHTFTGHTRAVTNLLLHPETSSIFISSSKDGSIRFWSLDIFSQLLSLFLFEDGIEWIGLTEINHLYCCSGKHCQTYTLNYFTHFWSYIGNSISHMSLASARGRTTRVTVLQKDSSLRIMSQSLGTKLSVVLPLPTDTPVQSMTSYSYHRANNLVFFLVDHMQIWIYTVRTDPACRAAVWSVPSILENSNGTKQSVKTPILEGVCLSPFDGSLWKAPVCECCCVACLSSTIYFTTLEGLVCADSDEFLLLGLEDGRILFMDIEVESLKYHEIQAHKAPVILLKHDTVHNQLLSMSQETSEKRLKIWSLPKLQLLHEVPIPQDAITFSRIASQLCVALESGFILFVDIVAADSVLLSFSPSVTQDVKNESESKREIEHSEGTVMTDACPKQNIFLSCSGDGVIQIWDLAGSLLTEFVLDHTLTFASFLNIHGDILIGFKDHLFLIPHKKLMIDIKDYLSDDSAKESDIYEDPAIKYELKDSSQRQVDTHLDMDSYLVPFKHLDFKESGIVTLSSEEESDLGDTESLLKEYTPASTGTYNSPASSVMSWEICRLTPGTDLDENQGDWPSVGPSDGSPKVLRCVSTELLMPEVGDFSVSPPPLIEVILRNLTIDSRVESEESLLPVYQESMEEDSVATSVEDVRKQLHVSRGAVAVHRLKPPIEGQLSFSDSADLIRRGLKIEHFAHQQKKKLTKTRGISKQPVFLDIYENKEALHRRLRRKQRKDKIIFPSFSKKFGTTSTGSEWQSSNLQLETEHHRTIRGRQSSSISDWINSELKRRETQAIGRLKREALNQKRRQVQDLERIQRQRSLPGHTTCNHPQAVLQVMDAHARQMSHQVVQSSAQPLSGRLRGQTLYPKPLMFPPPGQATQPVSEISPEVVVMKPVGIPPVPVRPPPARRPPPSHVCHSERDLRCT